MSSNAFAGPPVIWNAGCASGIFNLPLNACLAGGAGGVSSVSGSAPLSSSGGANPDISMTQADTSTDGWLSSVDWNTFNNKQDTLTLPLTIANGGTHTTSFTAGSVPVVNAAGTAIVDDGSHFSYDLTKHELLFNTSGINNNAIDAHISTTDLTPTTAYFQSDAHATVNGNTGTTAFEGAANIRVDAGVSDGELATGLAFAATRSDPADAGDLLAMIGAYVATSQFSTDPAASEFALVGGSFNIAIESGTVDLAASLGISGQNIFTGGTITTAADIYVLGSTVTGSTITNRWGILVSPDDVGTKYNFIADRLMVGSSVDKATEVLDIDGNARVRGHGIYTGTAPTALVNANAGTSATCDIQAGTDEAGRIALVTGSGAWASGTQCVVTFHTAYDVAPICVFSPLNAATATGATTVKPYMSSSTTTNTVSFVSADTAAISYLWSYHCFQTQ